MEGRTLVIAEKWLGERYESVQKITDRDGRPDFSADGRLFTVKRDPVSRESFTSQELVVFPVLDPRVLTVSQDLDVIELGSFSEVLEEATELSRDRRRLPKSLRREIFREYEAGEPTEEIAERYGVPRKTVYNVANYLARKRRGSGKVRQLSEEDKQEIAELYKAGRSTSSLADMFDKSPHSILEVLSERGIEPDRGYRAQERSGEAE